jgi:hypothetical protein
MTVLITLTVAGANTGPFDLYSNVDGYVSAFETGVSKSVLLAGYSSALVPNGTTVIRVKSNGVCVNFVDINVASDTTTTTSTTTTSTPGESWEARYSNSFGSVCGQPSLTVYLPVGAPFTTGTTVFIDAGLTTALTGYTYISELLSGVIYEIDSSNGLIGANTGTIC